MNLTIETEGLTKSYGKQTAVTNLDLQIPPKCVFGFLGENGAGKTTTFKLLLGLLRPSGGRIRLFGTDVAEGRGSLMRRVGALIEGPSLYGHLTGEEHLRMLCWMRRLPLSEVAKALSLVDMLSRAKQRTTEYSHGMKQRLGIAMALLGSPELILLDEPTNGLDPSGIRDIRELILSIPERTGATVFVSSHLLTELERVAPNLVIMSRGRRIFQGTFSDLRQTAQPVVTLYSAQVDRVCQVLADWQPEVKGPDRCRMPVGEEQIPTIRQLLSRENLAVDRIVPEHSSLEDVYFQMIKASE